MVYQSWRIMVFPSWPLIGICGYGSIHVNTNQPRQTSSILHPNKSSYSAFLGSPPVVLGSDPWSCVYKPTNMSIYKYAKTYMRKRLCVGICKCVCNIHLYIYVHEAQTYTNPHSPTNHYHSSRDSEFCSSPHDPQPSLVSSKHSELDVDQ